MTQSHRQLLPIMRASSSLSRARARSGSLTARVYQQSTNLMLSYNLIRTVHRGQLEMRG